MQLLALVFLLFACNNTKKSADETCPPGEGLTNAGECRAVEGDADADDDGPVKPLILTLSTDVVRLTEGESVLFSVVVTDPQGIGDIIGGTLSDPGGATYGVFTTFRQEGAYSASVSWSEVHRLTSLEFDATTNKTFVAEFYDQAGHSVKAEASIEFHCDGVSACDGRCVDKATSLGDCGTCGRECGAYCNVGVCVEFAECHTVVATTSCATVCTGLGKTCSTLCPGSRDVWVYGDPMCDFFGPWPVTKTCAETFDPPAAMDTGISSSMPDAVRCCCSD